jgi:hypothetical protein
LNYSRRKFLTLAGVSAAGTVLASPLQSLYMRALANESVLGEGYGSLVPDPNGLLDLPRGFQYRVFSRTGDMMDDGNPVPGDHDGMAAFAGPRGTTILVRNHELSPDENSGVMAPDNMKFDPLSKGGTTTLVVGRDRQLIRHYASLAGTYRNCSGGPTPWGSWVSCEENTSTPAGNKAGNPNNVSKKHGYNFEVPAKAEMDIAAPKPLIAMGRFNHEAIAVEPESGYVYQTEDRDDSCFYRFRPDQYGKLERGALEALRIKNGPQFTGKNFPMNQPFEVEWVRMEDVDPAEDTLRAEAQSKGCAVFVRGEGTAYGNNSIYFTCTSGGNAEKGQIFKYDPQRSILTLVVESPGAGVLDNPDNVEVAPFGDLILCEDGDEEQFLVGVKPNGMLYQLARNAINTREFAGATFSPDGQTLFVNIQDPGITFAIWGPWRRGGRGRG